MTPPLGTSGIQRYEAQITVGTPAESCIIIPSGGQTLKCQLTGLQSKHHYTVEVKACLPDPLGCGAVKANSFWTRPPRELDFCAAKKSFLMLTRICIMLQALPL